MKIGPAIYLTFFCKPRYLEKCYKDNEYNKNTPALFLRKNAIILSFYFIGNIHFKIYLYIHSICEK